MNNDREFTSITRPTAIGWLKKENFEKKYIKF